MQNVLPRTSAERGSVSSAPLLRNSINVEANTALRNEIDHMSFQRQNWFGGINSDSAAVISRQLSSTGTALSSNAGTG